MANDEQQHSRALNAVASYLEGRREEILRTWEEGVRTDPELKVAATLSSHHLRDMIPQILKRFGQRLRALPDGVEQELSEHGVHRWQQSYSLRELSAEWGHLQRYVMAEIDGYGLAHPDFDPIALARARQIWLELCAEGVTDTVEKYHELHKAEASGLLHDLQSALEHAQRLERQRAEVWHEAAHDLRGNVGVVTTAAALLTEDGVPEALRSKAIDGLQSTASFLFSLLKDLMDLARLEAGREHRQVERFDAAVHLRGLCSALESVARARGLFLLGEGPESLWVEGDRAKVQRIVQNLVLNALQYTPAGGVTVTWGESLETDVERWRVRVEDTGPGLCGSAPGSPIADRLREATESAYRVEEQDASTGAEPVPRTDPPESFVDVPQKHGEGIGLSIVKRLCELLDASLDLASTSQGTTFQVVLPRRYGASEGDGEHGPGVFGESGK